MTVPNSPASDAGVSEQIDALLDQFEVRRNRSLVSRILRSGLHLGLDGTDRLDLKITAAALEEMREAFRLFQPWNAVPKVTVFGSARTEQPDPLYQHARQVAARLAEHGWMVVTGAGPGIMQAAAEGAGPELAIGVSIRLPFEEKPSELFQDASDDIEARLVSMKYFFTRKLMLMKESRGFVCLPGGFGTLDETFELFTLQQTGKAEPVPIVLLDEPGGTYWRGLKRFVDDELVTAGMVSADDLDRALITDSVDEAVADILDFWRNYDSLRWVGDRLVLRMRSAPTDAQLADLNHRFGDLLAEGQIERTDPLPAEQADHDRVSLPRLVLTLRQRQVGGLYRLIRAINALSRHEF